MVQIRHQPDSKANVLGREAGYWQIRVNESQGMTLVGVTVPGNARNGAGGARRERFQHGPARQ